MTHFAIKQMYIWHTLYSKIGNMKIEATLGLGVDYNEWPIIFF